jgi:predicted GNAT family acetyltransferase
MTHQDVTVEHEDHGARGRYRAALAPGVEAEMTYHRLGDGVISIDHTGVPREFEGRGIALQLIRAAIADAREKGFRIIPRCSYVAAQFKRHPDWSDLLAR